MLVGVQETLTEVMVGEEPPPPPLMELLLVQPVIKDDKETMTTSRIGQPQGLPETDVRTNVTISASLHET